MQTQFDEIVSIKKIGKKQTIDIEVSGDHLFFANDILTHNSAINLPIEKVNESFIAESSKKMNTADNLIVIGGTQEQRQNGQLYAKSLKARLGQKDAIVPLAVDYRILRIVEDV